MNRVQRAERTRIFVFATLAREQRRRERQERFMRRVLALAAVGLPFFIHSAFAQDYPRVISGVHPQAEPTRRDNLGGGFVEYLLTGSANAAPHRVVRPAPAYGAQIYAPRPADSSAGGYVPSHADYAALANDERPQQAPPEQFRRQEVAYDTLEAPGTVVIDTPNKFLYLVEPDGRALRYGVGVGRPGFSWAGVKQISRKAEWPGWTPPPEMLLRRPDLPRHMDGGVGNPLGARALYLGSSMYRIHGTNEPWTIGQNVSSGCIRMMNDDVIDLYGRVKVGTRVIVM
jgi:lipoprotein-anchoring transpeptidase ErfK/SrfK